MQDTKRPLSLVSGVLADHDDKKQHTKVGRKPIETEPKSKRTAQNRAAQRAYRERKERKMKDLEDKVALLEDDRIKAVTELDLLKAQVDLLKRELSRYRGHSDFSDLKIVSDTKVKQEPREPQVSVGFPWSNKNLNSIELSDSSASQLPDLVSSSTSSDTSPLNENPNVSPESNTTDNSSLPVGQHLSPQNQFNMVAAFDEQLDPFCTNLGEACGTRQKPVPKYRREGEPVPPLTDENNDVLPQWSTVSPFHSLFSPSDNLTDPFLNGTTNLILPPTAQDDPLSFLNDNNFDVSLAFGNIVNDVTDNSKAEEPADPLAGLTTEESAYDPYAAQVPTDFNFNEFVKSSLPSEVSSTRDSVSNSVLGVQKASSSITSFNSPSIKEDAEEKDEVVPAPEQTLKCAEIWDRITSHPRYTDIDIDGLCSELKSKARCSELGVVLNAKDVNSLLERSALKR